jgi:hypothetical protein
VTFPSSKKKRLCRVNRAISVDRGTFASVDFTGKLNGWEKILSPMVPLNKSEGAVMMVSEEITVDVDGDPEPVIGMVSGCWAMSRPGSGYVIILPVLQREGLQVDDWHDQDQRLYDRLRTAREYQFPTMGSETSSWQTHCGHAHRSTAAERAADEDTIITIRLRSSLFMAAGRIYVGRISGRTLDLVSGDVIKGQPTNQFEPARLWKLGAKNGTAAGDQICRIQNLKT